MPRQVITNSGIGRADVEQLLLDRQWHSVTEVIQALAPRINPEEASRKYVHDVGGGPKQEEYKKRRAAEPPDVQVAMGKKKIVENLLHGHIFEVVLTADPASFEKQKMVRLAIWYCWSCGASQNGQGDSQRRLCSKCADAIA